MNEKAKELMAIFEDRFNASLKYSTTTRKFYVASDMEFSDGRTRFGISEHRDTPEAAVFAFHEVVSTLENFVVF